MNFSRSNNGNLKYINKKQIFKKKLQIKSSILKNICMHTTFIDCENMICGSQKQWQKTKDKKKIPIGNSRIFF